MKNKHTLKVVYSALFATMIFAGTQWIRMPLPFGYFHFGDCFILLAAFIIGGSYAVAASVIGSVLADIVSGYIIYAPATIPIKSLMALTMIFITKSYKKARSNFYKFPSHPKKKNQIILLAGGAVISELIMVIGYFIYDTFLYSPAGAIAALPGNVLQAAAASITSVLIITILEHSNLLNHIKL